MNNAAPLTFCPEVYQAQGMVSAQCGCSVDCAMVRMENRVRMFDVGVEQIALGVVDRSIRFGQPADSAPSFR